MQAQFYLENRERLARMMEPSSVMLIFSGEEVRKTNDEHYPFYADRNFVYLTGLDCKEAILMLIKGDGGDVQERLYILPEDRMAERWTGRRIHPGEARERSGVQDIRYTTAFPKEIHGLLAGGHFYLKKGTYEHLYLDVYRAEPGDRDRPAHRFLKMVQTDYPYLRIENANAMIRKLRLIKAPCEIEAVRKAEIITRDGILAMMRASRPGMWEYQYKAEFDRALLQYGPEGPGFPSIISAGENNFCIHYYSYTGQARDGDMVLNDVGAQWDYHTTDVSRGWPCNGKFSGRQKLLFECALATSNHMFSIIRPGMRMADVDRLARAYNAERLVEAGVMKNVDEVGTYMWHAGAHHVGFDVHDVVETPELIAPNMIFCVDIGIYHEAWGIGFRIEDNCLVTEDGCENLSAMIPRTVEDIEAAMA
ncbi:MAG: aminopeptidase P N-terminal domain-containing protein [Clostridia bacterium]|nr:aminopeptidase P N-terminal domain-containing protein [Clostridia bacterium]